MSLTKVSYSMVTGAPVNIKDFGAVGDGVTDDTAAIQAAFDASLNIVVPAGNFMIDAVGVSATYDGGVKPQSGSTIVFQGDAKFTAITNNASAYVIMNLRDTENVTIINGNVVGDVGSHTGTAGEYGFGFYVASATNARLINCQASKCWGDGFYVGYSIETTGTPSVGGILENCIADDNRRQGLSITSWVKGMVWGGEYKNTGLTAYTEPAYGIDIEPDDSGNDEIDVTMVGVRTSGNKLGGLQFAPGLMSNSNYTRPKFNVRSIGHTSYQDGTFYGAGIRWAYPSLDYALIDVANTVYGSIIVDDPTIIQATGPALDFARWVPTAPTVVINNPYIIDSNTSGSTVNNRVQSAVVMYVDSAYVAYQTETGAVTINSPQVIDSRATPKTLIPFWLEAGDATQKITNFKVTNFSGSGWSVAPRFFACTRSDNVNVIFDEQPVKDFAVSDTFVGAAWAGYNITASAAIQIDLPLAASSIGLEYTFSNPNAVDFVIAPNAADRIYPVGLGTGTSIVLRSVSDKITVRATAAGTWVVVAQDGETIHPILYGIPKKIIWNSAAPVANSWVQGDRVLNVAPTVGQPKSWVCTVSGTPGTWVSEGTL